MYKLHYYLRAVGIAGLLALLSATVSAQEVVPTTRRQDTFASLHTSLNDAADRSLAAALADKSWMKPWSGNPSSDTTLSRTDIDPVERLRAAVDRVRQLRFMIEPVLREEGIPPELAALVLVESGGIPTALSPKGARGVWQFMPDTARRYGLVVDPSRDDRTDIWKSTRAAARYLRDLHARFGDWSLALAAYNAGEVAVTNAMTSARSRDFAFISDRGLLPRETREYVPAVVAAISRLNYVNSWDLDRKKSPATRIVYASSGSGE